MSRALLSTVLLLAASYADAQYGPGGNYGPGNPYGGGDDNGGFDGSGFSSGAFGQSIGTSNKIVVAHGVLGALAFVAFFPIGSILIRLGSFRGLWLVHGLWQLFTYLVFIAAAGLGIYIVQHAPIDLWREHHPIIGLVLLGVLFFQPVFGIVHHFMYKKRNCRTISSYLHIWIGRVAITLGIINGGFGLQLASRNPFGGPSRSAIIAYSVVAAIMWLVYVACAIFGEIKRKRAREMAAAQSTPYKNERHSGSGEPIQCA